VCVCVSANLRVCVGKSVSVSVPPFGIFRNWGSLQQTHFVVDV